MRGLAACIRHHARHLATVRRLKNRKARRAAKPFLGLSIMASVAHRYCQKIHSSDILCEPSLQLLPDGRPVTGFFTSDYTLAEMQSLWATQALPSRDASHNRQHRRAPLGCAAPDQTDPASLCARIGAIVAG